jgi:hypothetical protein
VISNDGKYAVACSGTTVLLSNNYGKTFQSIDVNGFGNIVYIGKKSLSISDSGICYLFYSDDTDEILKILSLNLQTQVFTSVLNVNIYQLGFSEPIVYNYCISGNGKYSFGIATYYFVDEYRSHIFISKDYGASYELMNLQLTSSYNITCIVASYTGQYISVGFNNGATIWDSDDYGASWKENIDFATPFRVNNATEPISAIAMSNTGQYRSIALQNHGLYYSNDFGKTYVASQFDFGTSILRISMTSSGKFQVVIVSNSLNIYYSSNYGVNWDLYVSTNITSELEDIQISKTGEYIYCTDTNDHIDEFIYSISTTEIFSIDGNLNISKNTSINSNLNVSGNTLINGNVNIGKNITIGGNLYAVNIEAYTFNATSDYRVKENPILLNDSFYVDDLKPIFYKNTLSNREDMGFLAHEVQEIFPFLVSGEKDGTDYQSVNYIGIIALLVKEMQEVKKKLKELTLSMNK